ncbi:MAG: P-loop NTPase fold protein [Myxococcota bacterium]
MSSPNAKSPAASLRSDEPIRGANQDRLGRGHLVEVIGDHIVHSYAPESVVVALNAPWGAGKSSFLNLLEQKLVAAQADEAAEKGEGWSPDRPIVVRFNPWLYTDVDQLVRMFFGELARGIGTAARREIGKKIGELLNVAGSLAAVFSSGAGGLLKEAGGALKQDRSLPQLKLELDKLLPELEQPVVIFIDDIDRLERDALRLLFRMIRLNADFPNITYVLAFDRLVVERNLDEENGIRGRDYLEKIIQVSFDIPEPEPSTTHRILFGEMDAVLDALRTRPHDQHRWGNVFNSGFKEHFRTIRHIKRYANGLRLTLAPVSQEVDLVDFLVVELLRVFHPEVYFGVAGGKEMLAPTGTGHREGVPVERLREWVEQLCKKASPGFESSVKELLRQLFPELARVYSNMAYDVGYHVQWRRDCRVCAPQVFDKFFLLALPEGEISETEIQAFVDQLGDLEATRANLKLALESGKARRLLERLEDFTKDLALENASHLLGVLFDQGDDLRFESRGFLDVTADMQVARIIYQCLARLSSEEHRHDLLLDCVAKGSGLYTLVQEVSLCEPKENATERRLFSNHLLWEELRDAAVGRIRDAEASGTLWRVWRLPFVLYRWIEWSSEEGVQAAVAQHVVEDDNFLTFLGSFVSQSRSFTMGDKVGRTRARLSKKEIASFMKLDVVVSRLKTIAAAADEDEDAVVIARELLGMIERKPEGPWDA